MTGESHQGVSAIEHTNALRRRGAGLRCSSSQGGIARPVISLAPDSESLASRRSLVKRWKRLTLALLGISLALMCLAACAHRIPETHYYSLALKPWTTDVSPAAPIPYTIAVAEFTGAAALESPELMYFPEPLNCRYYIYHRWVAAPAPLVSERLRYDLAASGLFARVSAQTFDADYKLRGFVSGFHEEDSLEGCFAVVTIEIELSTVSSNKLMWRGAYTLRRLAAACAPNSVVAAINTEIEEISGRLLTDLQAFFGR